MIRRIDHVSIAVRDLAKAKAFFIDVLGGKKSFRSPRSRAEIPLDHLGNGNFVLY